MQSLNPDGKHIYWTDDMNEELPIFVDPEVKYKIPPSDLYQVFCRTVKEMSLAPALRVKRDGHASYQTYSWIQYFEIACQFSRALIKFGINNRKSVNIVGFNTPEWAFTFFGAIFANCLPSGVYTTNTDEICIYQAEHSECEVVVADTKEQVTRYMKLLDRLPEIKAVVMMEYGTKESTVNEIADKFPQHKGKLFSWDQFLKFGDNKQELNKEFQKRVSSLRPGMCCDIIYTSGTTGNPKGAMLSHDNFIFNCEVIARHGDEQGQIASDGTERIISYLPLSHSAPQQCDLILPLFTRAVVSFARPDALQGTIVQTLQEVKPTIFFAVPRIWEKFYEAMQGGLKEKSQTARNMAAWAMDKSERYNLLRQTEPWNDPKMPQPESTMLFTPAKLLVLNGIKKALGLDQVNICFYGASAMAMPLQKFFMGLDLTPLGMYGMTETGGGITSHYNEKLKHFTNGRNVPGAEFRLEKQDQQPDNVGELCMRGRGVFIGYLKNDTANHDTFDAQGYLHSGDLASLDDGFLEIRGRIKELIITAGGENVAPVPLEDNFKEICTVCANFVVIGEYKKYLTSLMTLKCDPDTTNLNKAAITTLEENGITGVKTVAEFRASKAANEYVMKCLVATNKRAVSRASQIKKFTIIDKDFTVEDGELTPSMKLKRKVVSKKYEKEIDAMYQEAKL